MKYFTEELLRRFQSDDDDTADAAQDEWDRKTEEYRKHLDSLPAELRACRGFAQFWEFLDQHRLHDALVVRGRVEEGIASTVGNQRYYYLTICPESSPAQPIGLIYHLAAGETPRALPAGVYWLYDEVDVADAHAPWTLSHRILFADDSQVIELNLRFTGFAIDRPNSESARTVHEPCQEETRLDKPMNLQKK